MTGISTATHESWSTEMPGPRALRCIVPHGLRGVLVGVIPDGLAGL